MKTYRSILRGLICTALLILLCAPAQARFQDDLARIKQAKVGLFVHYVFRETKGTPALYTPMTIDGRKSAWNTPAASRR